MESDIGCRCLARRAGVRKPTPYRPDPQVAKTYDVNSGGN